MGGGPNTEETPTAEPKRRTTLSSLDSSTRSIPEEDLSSDSPIYNSVPVRVVPPFESESLPRSESMDEGMYGDDGAMTPGTDVSGISATFDKEKNPRASTVGRSVSEGRRRSSTTIAEFRENQMRCMQALRKGARAAAVVAAMRQTSEPVPMSYSTPLGGMSTQVSEESNLSDKLNEKYSDITAVDHLVADPLVAVVRSLTMQQNQAYKQLLDSLGAVRQDTFVHRQEIKDILKKHALEIEGLKEKKKGCKSLSVLKTFAAAFGVAAGASSAYGAVAKTFEVGVRNCPFSVGLSGIKPAEAATFVLSPRAGSIVARAAAGRPRRARSSTRP